MARESAAGAIRVAEKPVARYGKLCPGPGKLPSEVADHQRTRIHAAMVQLVGERGYAAVKVRDIVRLAGVSTRAFYEHFESKEDCFLRTHGLVVRGAARRILTAQHDEPSWQVRVSRIFDAFACEVQSGPNAARLALLDAYAAGEKALEQAVRTERTLEMMICENIARSPSGIVVPSLLVEGIVAGAVWVARNRLLAEQGDELAHIREELTKWALCYPGKPAGELIVLDRRSVVSAVTTTECPKVPLNATGSMWPPEDDREIILAAVTKLAAIHGYRHLTVPRIRARAGVSRASFDAHFEGVNDCFLAALDRKADEVLDNAALAQAAGQTWAGGIYRAITSLCSQIGKDPLLVNLCLKNEFAPGSCGSLWRHRLISATIDQVLSDTPRKHLSNGLVYEASVGAIWALFHHHVVRNPAQQEPQIAATLSYIALAPAIGATTAIDVVRREQLA